MKLQTLQFGELEISEQDLITFPHGLPAFEDLRRFVILQVEDGAPFSFLQSVEEGSLSFLIADPFYFFAQYEFELPESVKEDLKLEGPDDVMVRAIVTAGKNIYSATINLLAPLVFNVRERLGKQVVLYDSPYETKHRLFDRAGSDAGQAGRNADAGA